MKAEIEVNVDNTIDRFKKFANEMIELCSKYGLEPQFASDDETKENFIVINVKEFVKKEDIKINIVK